MSQPTDSLTYKDAGVDIDAGNALVERIKGAAKRTRRPEVMAGLGGFGAMCEIPTGYQQPVLVSGTDGVGTKLKLALNTQRFDTIGIDLVAMCVNDIIVAGAEPLFFLDYYATGQLDLEVATAVVNGIADGCSMAGCSLVGGETAEMPGMYEGSDFDLAGFSVGIVEKSKILRPEKVAASDQLIGLPSSGPHSNGYSLIRKVLEHSKANLEQPCGETTLVDALMAPTKIYVKSLLALMKTVDIHALCHITGGGLTENLPRVLPEHLQAYINTDSAPLPPVFKWLQNAGNIDAHEMYRTFNCGIGMVICVANDSLELTIAELNRLGEQPILLGDVRERPEGAEAVELAGLA